MCKYVLDANIHPPSILARIIDVLMVPLMYLISGTLREKPQRTHAWHVRILSQIEKNRLEQKNMVRCEGVKAIQRNHRWSFLFHVPIFGGWRHYVVLNDLGHVGTWHIGWSAAKQTAVSRLVLKPGKPVRMLLGPGVVSFFAVTDDGYQLPLIVIGKGRIGDRGPHSKITLL